MKRLKSIVSATFMISVALVSSSALADTVIVNGQSVSCTNTCVVTTHSDGSVSISDCCGGRVSSQVSVAQ